MKNVLIVRGVILCMSIVFTAVLSGSSSKEEKTSMTQKVTIYNVSKGILEEVEKVVNTKEAWKKLSHS